jgi:hypothetical protein
MRISRAFGWTQVIKDRAEAMRPESQGDAAAAQSTRSHGIENPLAQAETSCGKRQCAAANTSELYVTLYAHGLVREKAPAEKRPICRLFMMGRAGFEPATSGLKVRLDELKRTARN